MGSKTETKEVIARVRLLFQNEQLLADNGRLSVDIMPHRESAPALRILLFLLHDTLLAWYMLCGVDLHVPSDFMQVFTARRNGDKVPKFVVFWTISTILDEKS